MARDNDIRFDHREVDIAHESARGEVVRNVGTFTRGSQLIRLRYMMFMEGVRWPVLAALTSFTVILIVLLAIAFREHEVQLVEMRLFAGFWSLVDLDPTHVIHLTLTDDKVVSIAIGDVPDYPDVAVAWTKFLRCILVSTLGAAVLTGPLARWFIALSRKIGVDILKERHERGAMRVSAEVLAAEIAVHNDNELRAELAATGSLLDPEKVATGTIAERLAAGVHVPCTMAGIAYPWRLEQTHAMLIGSTGAGKTTQLRNIVTEARERHQRCVIFDLTGAFVEAFYRPETDHILNPMDERCPPWTIFNDCQNYAEYTSAAAALIPSDGNAEPFWAMAARTLFVEMCVKLAAAGETTNGAIAHRLMEADLKQVHAMLANTIAAPMTAMEAARMAESIRAVFNTNALAIRFMPDPVPGGAPAFSIRNWVQADNCPGSILFITSTHGDLAFTRALLTLWMDLAVNALMEMPRTRNLRMWFLFDELHALHRLPAIEHGLQTARGFGGAFVLGLHSFDKLAQTYGEEGAINLASLARTKLILTTADRHTAEVCSDFIGSHEVRETDEAYSIGATRSRDAATITPRTDVKPLVIPDDLMNLRSLDGYVKFPEGFPAARIRLAWRDYPAIAEPYCRRRDIDPTQYQPPVDPDDNGPKDKGPDGQGGRENALPREPDKALENGARVNPIEDRASPQHFLPFGPPLPISALQNDGTSSTDPAPRAEEETANGAMPDARWRESLRLVRGAVPGDDARREKGGEGLPGQSSANAQSAAPRREQQITLEERTGQSFADPGEKHEHRHPGASGAPPEPDLGLDNGVDNGRDIGL